MFIMRMHKFIIEIVGNHLSQQDGLPQHPTCIGSTQPFVRPSIGPSVRQTDGTNICSTFD